MKTKGNTFLFSMNFLVGEAGLCSLSVGLFGKLLLLVFLPTEPDLLSQRSLCDKRWDTKSSK